MPEMMIAPPYISSERMVTLINDFLNVSRLQTGKFIIDKRETDMVEMLKEQVQMLSVVAKQHGLRLDLQVTGKVPRVWVDGDKLRQVMLNMIDNAIYYILNSYQISGTYQQKRMAGYRLFVLTKDYVM